MYGTRMVTYVVGANGGCGVAPVLFFTPIWFNGFYFVYYVLCTPTPPNIHL